MNKWTSETRWPSRIKNHNNRSACLFVLSVLTLETEGWAQNLTVSLTSCVTWGKLLHLPETGTMTPAAEGLCLKWLVWLSKPPSMLYQCAFLLPSLAFSDWSRVGSRICMCYVFVLSMYYERCPGQRPREQKLQPDVSPPPMSCWFLPLTQPEGRGKESDDVVYPGQPLGSEWRRVESEFEGRQIASVLTHRIFCREISIQVLWPFFNWVFFVVVEL